MSSPAAWHNDPYGRFAKRYWDGNRWTEHVVTGDGRQQVDPMGTSTVVPFALPDTATGGNRSAQTGGHGPGSGGGPAGTQGFVSSASGAAAGGWQPPAQPGPVQVTTEPPFVPSGAGAPATATAGGNGGSGGLWALLERMSPDSHRRPTPRLDSAIAGIGGVVAAAAIAAFVIGNKPDRGKAVLAFALILGLALAVRLLVTSQLEARAAAVGAGAVGIVGLSVAATVSDTADPSSAVPWLVMAALALAAWALPGFFGRPLMLGVGLQAAVLAVAAGTTNGDDIFGDVSDRAASSATAARYILLVLGALMMVVVWYLDRRGYRGTATPIVAVGLVTTLLAGFGVAGSFGDTGGPLLIVAVGVLISIVGGNGRRRATTWVGAAIAAGGLIGLLGNSMKPRSATDLGGMLLIAAALLIAGAILLSRWRASRPANEAPSENVAH